MAALGLVSLSLAACEYRWVLDKAEEHGSTSHGSTPHGSTPQAPDAGGKPDASAPSCQAPSCQDGMLIDDTLCKDPATFKDEAWKACTAAGLVLTAYTPEKECGNGQYRYARYTCCPKADPTPPPPPPAPAPACKDGMLIDDTLCKDPATFKDEAWKACDAAGLILTAYTPEKECGNGQYRYVRYTCCPKADPTPPPPPDPRSCVTQKQGGGTSCKDVGTWKQYAYQSCEDNGLLLTDYRVDDQCGDGLYRVVAYTCCKRDSSTLPPSGPTEPPDPFAGAPIPGPSHLAQFKCCASESDCYVVRLGSDSVCQDTDAWTAEAKATCAAKERTLYGLGLYGACKP